MVHQDAAGDLCWGAATSNDEGYFVSQFDASNTCIIGGLGTGSDQTFNTGWTPKFVRVLYGSADTTPAAGEAFLDKTASQLMLDTNWYATQLNISHDASTHNWVAAAGVGAVKAITPQAAGTSGSFTTHAMADGRYFYAIASTDRL